MAEGLDGALRALAGGGRRGTALSATRFLPAAAAGVCVPTALQGSGAALACVVLGLAATAAAVGVDARLRYGP
jgi:hypothetical protein